MTVLLRFLATGDLQADNWKQFAHIRKDGMNSRLYNCLSVFDILKKEAKKRDIDKVLINGDIFEKTDFIDVDVYDGVYRRLEELDDAGLEVVLNLGNHDISRSSGRLLHSLRPFRKVAKVVERPRKIWNHLQIVPYMGSPEEFKKTIKEIEYRRNTCLVLHIGVQGAVTGPTRYLVRNPIHLRDIRSTDFDLVVLSDYHTSQQLSENVFYLGSPLQHTFGEVHRPCIWEVRILSVPPHFRLIPIPTPFPRFRRIRINKVSEIREKLGACQRDYLSVTIPVSGKVTPESVEEIAEELGCKVRVSTKGEDESESPNVHLWDPREHIQKYTDAHARDSQAKRLFKLGMELYE